MSISCSRLLIVADLHLGASSRPGTADRFLRLLDRAPALADALVINGDLFDFWFGWKGALPPEGTEILPALAHLAEAMPVQLVGGNHDRWGDGGWATRFGLHWAPWRAVMRVGDQRVTCHHGDGLGTEGFRSRLLHAVVAAPITQRAVGMLPATVGYPLVRRFGPSLDGAPTDDATLERDARRQRAAAEAWLAADADTDWLVLAHTHRAQVARARRGANWCNPGAFAFAGSYAVLGPDGVALAEQA